MGSSKRRAEDQWIALFERVLGGEPAERQHTFEFLRGDPTPKYPKGVKLRVDAYFEQHRLVLEYLGEQHFESNKLMDRRPGRAEQRRRYDQLRLDVLPQHGIKVLQVRFDEPLTEAHVRLRLREVGINP